MSSTALFSGCENSLLSDKEIFESPYAGITVQEQKVNKYKTVIVTIDPKKYHLSLIQNPAAPNSLSIRQIHEKSKALVTVNGAFYTPDFLPTGLLISKGETLHKANDAKLTNGILIINKANEISLMPTDKYLQNPPSDIDFAIQNGPILVNEKGDSTILEDDKKTASRTALALNKNGDIVIVIIRQTLLDNENNLSLFTFANLLATNPLFEEMSLHSALNLDGGNSTGLAVADRIWPEMEKVQNVIIFTARS